MEPKLLLSQPKKLSKQFSVFNRTFFQCVHVSICKSHPPTTASCSCYYYIGKFKIIYKERISEPPNEYIEDADWGYTGHLISQLPP